ncbi:MAG TPA: GNAT family N-acetyltransferase [Gemmatimonadaceae bacterium]|nr:GNAT family N-acetyltransferase [Gemmatimonadaceae bacterium]
MRDAFRAEMNCQIVHDSIHYRRGWTREFALAEGDHVSGYASLAVEGPWRNRPTFYELYVTPDRRSRTYALFEAFLDATHPPAFEVQSSDVLSTTMALTFARDIATERVIFRDHSTTKHSLPGATLRCVTTAEDIQAAIAARQGGGEWLLELGGAVAGNGGILFHYNPPYGDVYVHVNEEFSGRGFGSFLVQELKRLCYELGAIPAARCDPTNTVSQRTLQRAGFLPYAHILIGSFGTDGSGKQGLAAQ